MKVAVAASLALATSGCGASEPPPHLRITGGDASAGRQLIRSYGCGTCHLIDGIAGARGAVGPPLTNFAHRTILAGRYPNAPRNLVPWLMNPQAMAPFTAMPTLGITAQEARDIATFLYTQGAADVAVPAPIPAAYPWLEHAEAYRAADSRRLTGTVRIDPQRARIPIERAMELLADPPPGN
ncbi:MAG: c-type cytochrome [Hyphomicrobiaceae bacterium]|nr:c-type cytochrome [Hyphomicrobiaceae bacterium]